jgi:hypothetical protein
MPCYLCVHIFQPAVWTWNFVYFQNYFKVVKFRSWSSYHSISLGHYWCQDKPWDQSRCSTDSDFYKDDNVHVPITTQVVFTGSGWRWRKVHKMLTIVTHVCHHSPKFSSGGGSEQNGFWKKQREKWWTTKTPKFASLLIRYLHSYYYTYPTANAREKAQNTLSKTERKSFIWILNKNSLSQYQEKSTEWWNTKFQSKLAHNLNW